MKTLITTIITLTLLIANTSKPCLAQQTTTVSSASATGSLSLSVTISNVNKRSGKLYVGLATSQANFMGDTPQKKSVDVTPSGEITLTFDGLAPGKYAVRVYQDLNDNQKMDFTGQMPSEPFGFSNVAMLMGPPDFDQSSFELKENQSVKVRLLEM
ncbi:DUF2141 domain-containing protein [Spirosoma validum]|uniref:DUF2141 domain-containing protein n=1 Tax=Spirosoma validum TaxID=2771355 RepID=A0A927AYF0_9BACT|nr:DUF2141 domain-containing protein [Spirosoma validum]MBD2752151.1 DUF2141 domain-containing protein [Spirosoma validum]